MIIQVRCFACGKVIGSAYEDFVKRVELGESPKEVLQSLKLDRYCCRRMLLTHANLIDELAPY